MRNILLLLLLASCGQPPANQPAAIWDEAALRSWVLRQPVSVASVDSLLHLVKEDSAIFRQTVTYLEKPFGDPNSSLRNPAVYLRLLEAKLPSRWYIAAEKEVTRTQIKLLQQNEPGQPANDFTFVTPDGKQQRLYHLKSAYTLLYFYNPECEACKETKKLLEQSSVIKRLVHHHSLTVLAIYIDRDLELWKRHLAELPDNWVHGHDEGEYLYQHDIYNLKAIPSIYLLDRNKRVLLKDCQDIPTIESTLSR